MPKATETVLEIDLNALEKNFFYLRNKLEPGVKFLGVVKAFAYGNDAAVIAKKLQELGADYLAVAYTSEGISLRKAGIELPILVLHPQSTNFKELINHCLEPNLYSPFVLQSFRELAESEGQKSYPVHIKFNTGLNRLGFNDGEINLIAKHLNDSTAIKAVSIFSHLAASEDWKERDFTLGQIQSFRKLAAALFDQIGYEPMLHLCNTSGIINYPEARFDMVRSGIGLYGFGNDQKEDKNLNPIAQLKTIISQIHYLKEGESVGYNRAFIAGKKTKTATLPIGHADGINRQFGNGKAAVLVNGSKAPIIGNVCMDMIMIDITGIACEEGDEVIIFGHSQTASQFAEAGGTISYELITGISQRVRRLIINQ